MKEDSIFLPEFKEKEFLNLPSKEFDQENVTSVEASSGWINSCWLLLIGWDQNGGWGGGGGNISYIGIYISEKNLVLQPVS